MKAKPEQGDMIRRKRWRYKWVVGRQEGGGFARIQTRSTVR